MPNQLPSLTIPQKNLPSVNPLDEYTPPNWSKSAPQLYAITYDVRCANPYSAGYIPWC